MTVAGMTLVKFDAVCDGKLAVAQTTVNTADDPCTRADSENQTMLE